MEYPSLTQLRGLAGRAALAAPASCALVLLLHGCVVYQLGSTPPPGIKRIHVPIFVNKTGEPDLETVAAQSAIAEFQKDGTLVVAPRDNCDAVLAVTLTQLKLEPLRYEADRSKTAKEYRLRIAADVVLKRAGTEEIVLTRRTEGWSTFIVTGDMAASKRAAFPGAAENLARHIVSAVTEYW